MIKFFLFGLIITHQKKERKLTLELLQQIFDLCIVPLLGVLTTYLVQLIRKKTKEITNTTDDIKAKKYIELLSQTITDCVIATNQTYVDSLKGQNAFDEAAQKEAFKKTYAAVMNTINDDAYEYLQNVYGDLDEYIRNKIESEVKKEKA